MGQTQTTTPPARGFGYQPALDGLRGVAVAVVLLFHGGFTWASGGYVGVSVFFTLSGYLITSLALVEHDRTGRLDVVAFYGRRIRRLLPASLLCVAAVLIAARLGQFAAITNLRRDAWAAVTNVFNWVTLATGGDYAEQMSAAAGQRAPLDHYWSLAIEEQFYLVWPLALVVVLRRGHRGRTAAIGGLFVAAVAAAVVTALVASDAASYLATPARLSEILAGALLAVIGLRPLATTIATVIGVVALAAILAASTWWPADSGPAYDGWLPALAVASAALIAALQSAGPVCRVLSARPLVALGKISYGVYLFHWPVFALVDERTIDSSRWLLFCVRMAITLAVAALSFRLVEWPIRHGGTHRSPPVVALWRRRPIVVGIACTAVVAAGVVTIPDRDGTFMTADADTVAAAAITPVGDSDAPIPADRPLRVLVIGDSTAVALSSGMIEWAADHRDLLQVTSAAGIGCGLNPSGTPPPSDFDEYCAGIVDDLADTVTELEPDVVVALVTFRDLEDRTWNDDEGPLPITDERFQARLTDGYVLTSTWLLFAGAGTIVWLTPPQPALAQPDTAMADPERYTVYSAVLGELPSHFDGDVIVADFAEWFAAQDPPPDRHDGLHLSDDGAITVTEEFLLPLFTDLPRR